VLCEILTFLNFDHLYGTASRLSKKIHSALIDKNVFDQNREVKFVFDHNKYFDIDDLDYVI